jgi:GntR family transcriptional regulator
MSDIRQEVEMVGWSVRLQAEAQTLEERVSARMRDLIRDGTLKPGDQLPAEPVLAKQLGISRPTLRAAVSELIADRLLVRRRGVGTFVSISPPHLSQGLEHLLGTGQSIALLGWKPGTVGLRVRHGHADDDLAERLQTEVGEPLIHISRTRTADGVPVLHCEEWICQDVLPEESALDKFGPEDSLYEALDEIGLGVGEALVRFIPLIANTTLQRKLSLPAGRAVLLLEQQHFLDTAIDRVVLFSRNYYNCNLIDLRAVRRK